MRATCGNGFKCALRKDLEQWYFFDWGDQKHGYLVLLMNFEDIFIK